MPKRTIPVRMTERRKRASPANSPDGQGEAPKQPAKAGARHWTCFAGDAAATAAVDFASSDPMGGSIGGNRFSRASRRAAAGRRRGFTARQSEAMISLEHKAAHREESNADLHNA